MRVSVATHARPDRPWLDRLGIASSTLCAVHCAATALFAGLLSTLGASRLGDPQVETVFLAASLGVGAVSLGPSYPRHRSPRPALWLAAGFVLLLVVRPATEMPVAEVLAGVAGALCIVRAHWLNARLVTTCRRTAPVVAG